MADPEVRPFAPLYAPRQNIAAKPGDVAVQAQQGGFLPGVATTVATSVATASAVLTGVLSSAQVQFYVANKTDRWVHINFGVFGDVRAAVLTDPGLPPGTVMVFTVNPECNAASIFADGVIAAANQVVITRGVGS